MALRHYSGITRPVTAPRRSPGRFSRPLRATYWRMSGAPPPVKLRRVVDEDLARVVPELRPFLGREVELVVSVPTSAAAGRVSVREFLAMRGKRGDGT